MIKVFGSPLCPHCVSCKEFLEKNIVLNQIVISFHMC